ncbi:MAG: transglycosylase SLT domain-containing protein [Nitrolancea sp.]
MRFRRNPIIHVLVILVVLVIAVVGLKTHRFGIGGDGPKESAITGDATPVSLDRQNQLVETARKQRQQGRYEDAIDALKLVIASNNEATAAPALLESAKDHMALGDDSSAEETLKLLRKRYPKSSEADEAQFQLGQVEAAKGALSSAVENVQAYGKRHPLLSDYSALLAAKYQQQRGKSDAALSLASSVVVSDVADRTKVEALELMRDIQKSRNDWSAYLDSTNRLLSLATISAYRAELVYERSSAQLKLGQKDQAIAGLRMVVTEYPDSGYASNAVNDLVKLATGSPTPPSSLGLIQYDEGNYQLAMQTFNGVLGTDKNDSESWYYRAMSKLYAGDSWSAAVELKEMVQRYPTSSFTLKGLYTSGRIYEENGSLDDARSSYEALIQLSSHSVEATNARLRLGIILFEQSDYQGVVNTLRPVFGPSDARSQASFWEGKAYQKIGDMEKAKRAWTDATNADPYGYYGLRANQMLLGSQPVIDEQPNSNLSTSSSPTAQNELADWFALVGSSDQDARASLEQDPGYQRMSALYELGLDTEGDWEMSSLADKYDGSPASLAALGELLRDSGQYNATYRVGIKLQIVADNAGTHLPMMLQRLAYPIAYPELVQGQSNIRGVDPYLFLALVRQESGYDPTVTSSADAIGLAQIIPSTAAGMAGPLGVNNWSANMLYRPTIAVQFGVSFLSDRLATYNRQILPALAAYNAGEGNVAGWLTSGQVGDPDLFMERIPFPETHDYVKIVFANYLNYLRLYR